LTSKATFSRRKTSLEDDGVIYVEREPVDVGRPRDRLHLADNISGVNIDIGLEDETLGISTSSSPDSENQPKTKEQNLNDSELGIPSELVDNNHKNEKSDILTEIEEAIQDAIQSG
jgi:hypothetical protein